MTFRKNFSKNKWIYALSIIVVFIFSLTIKNFFESKKISLQKSNFVIKEGKILAGESIYSVLRKENILVSEIQNIISVLEKIYEVRKCKAGDVYKIIFSSNNFVSFEYKPSILETYIVKKVDDKYVSVYNKEVLKQKVSGYYGELKSSLYETMVNDGVPVALILQFADIFAWQIDFLTEPRNGDKFGFIVEQYFVNGSKYSDGKILCAFYEGKVSGIHYAFFFDDGETKDYYDMEGSSLTKEFLKAPLNYRRISSYFSKKRFHPVLRYFRPHLGIDYAAPTGTPVVSIGSGRVVFAGWKGGFGKMVQIRHNSVYTTSYGHLSKIARGIKVGKQVQQGEVIGYVGSTGLATGPHLDFRITKNGQYVNFLKLNFPTVRKVKESCLERFNKIQKYMLKHLDRVKSFNGMVEIPDFNLG